MIIKSVKLWSDRDTREWHVQTSNLFSPNAPKENILEFGIGFYQGFFREEISDKKAIELVKQFAKDDIENCLIKLKDLK